MLAKKRLIEIGKTDKRSTTVYAAAARVAAKRTGEKRAKMSATCVPTW